MKERMYCVDPFRKHKSKILRGVQGASSALEASVNDSRIKKGTPLCVSCRKALIKNPSCLPSWDESPVASSSQSSEPKSSASPLEGQAESSTSSNKTVIEQATEMEASQIVADVLDSLQETPVRSKGLSKAQKQSVGSSKLKKAQQKLKRKFSESLRVEMPETPAKKHRTTEDDDTEMYQKMMDELKEEFKNTNSYQRRLRILTLSPFSMRRTSKFFDAPMYMVRKSKELKEEKGIMPDSLPAYSKGKKLAEGDKAKVTYFYESDLVSRVFPGKKDFVSVTDKDGVKTHVQKRLILGNLKEIYEMYKGEKTNPRIGFSTFASLRPKHCVLLGGSGTHTVCVCCYHQNTKLMIEALGIRSLSYKTLMQHAVCDVLSRKCMMGECDKCPGEAGVRAYLDSLLSDAQPEEIRYFHWGSADRRCTLEEHLLPLEDFLSKLSFEMSRLTKHHFTANHQSKYFDSLKCNLQDNEAILLCDFSENYTFIIQDAVQSFHWDAPQCTVHPFVLYWKDGGEVKHKSFCALSDELKHTTVAVHTFLQYLLPEIRVLIPGLEKVHYFSDGAASQYKNRFNFANIHFHFEDFGIDCEWHYFATSHGKNACDGIGGTLKRVAAQASLARPLGAPVQTAEGLCELLNEKTSTVCFFISKTEVLRSQCDLDARFHAAKPVRGTLGIHHVIPRISGEVMVSALSGYAPRVVVVLP